MADLTKMPYLALVFDKFFTFLLESVEKNEAGQPAEIVEGAKKGIQFSRELLLKDKTYAMINLFINTVVLKIWDDERKVLDQEKLQEFIRNTYQEQYMTALKHKPDLAMVMAPFEEWSQRPFFAAHIQKMADFFACMAEVYLS